MQRAITPASPATRPAAAAASRRGGPRAPLPRAAPSTAGRVAARADTEPASERVAYDLLCYVSYDEEDRLSARDARLAAARPDIFRLDDVGCVLTYSEEEDAE